jgi:hypothetical protein
LVFDTPETLFERAGPLGGDPAGMPIETEYTAEGVEAERIGPATKPLLGAAIDDDMCGNFAREPRHPREEPHGGSAGMYRKVDVAGATGQVKSYGFLRRRYVTTVRASGSNPKFRMN